MANLNKVLLMGNLTRDPEMRYTPSGQAICKLGLATNRKFRDSKSNEMRDETTFVDIDVWGRQAETANQYLAKGRNVLIEGRLKYDQWEDKQTGQKRSRITVVCERWQFGASAGGGGGGERNAGKAAAPVSGAPEEDLQAPNDDIPF